MLVKLIPLVPGQGLQYFLHPLKNIVSLPIIFDEHPNIHIDADHD